MNGKSSSRLLAELHAWDNLACLNFPILPANHINVQVTMVFIFDSPSIRAPSRSNAHFYFLSPFSNFPTGIILDRRNNLSKPPPTPEQLVRNPTHSVRVNGPHFFNPFPHEDIPGLTPADNQHERVLIQLHQRSRSTDPKHLYLADRWSVLQDSTIGGRSFRGRKEPLV